ncbi:MAG TPA: hypothetical protein VGV16_10815 [Gammaproteobacteria bacterium]|nr:hypothetical protein [Gammaproteobacteria bacterium]
MTGRLIHRLRRLSTSRSGRALWLALLLLLTAVQTTLPAHEESHHLGQADVLCQYCVLGGHLYSLTSAPPAPVLDSTHDEVPLAAFVSFHVPPFPRTLYSRGPPSSIDV